MSEQAAFHPGAEQEEGVESIDELIGEELPDDIGLDTIEFDDEEER